MRGSSTSPAPRSSLERLRALLLDEGGLMASLVDPAGAGPQAPAGEDHGLESPAQLAASGAPPAPSASETPVAPQKQNAISGFALFLLVLKSFLRRLFGAK